jgi:putative ATPase
VSVDLFDNEENISAQAPLAARMRPREISQVLGQDHLLNPGSPLARLLAREKSAPPALILYGPPGCGKTTIALLLAEGRRFRQLSAVSAGIKEVREEIEAARYQLSQRGTETILFIDEVHRFNKAQQDALLPAVEDKIVTLIAATTENPSFSIITPLLSRSLVVRLEALDAENAAQIIARAIAAPNGLNGSANVEPDAQEELIRLAHGDARRLLTYLEAAAGAAVSGVITRESVAAAADRSLVDFNIDLHYDIISAFIKSVRGSDVDAALHYLLRAIEGGEDLRFLARRLVILASEDIGMADSQALVITTAAAQAVALVGAPEGHYALVHATVYCAMAPKSNALGRAMQQAQSDISDGDIGQVPENLRDGNSPFGQKGIYRYPHDYPEGVVSAEYLPKPLVGRRYYEPSDHGAEARIGQALIRIREILEGKK